MNNLILFQKLTFISHAFMKKNANHKSVSRGQGRILAVLNMKDGISTKQLSEILNIKVTSLNETLNKLQEKGFLEKRPSAEDGRILLIYLTDKGREFKPKPPKDLDIFDCLSENEKEEFDKYLTLIAKEFQEKMRNENPEKFEKMMKHRQEIINKYFDGNDEMFRL